MRLSSEEVMLLKSTLKGLDEKAELYLFGSRVDDNKRGGDIDLLIVSSMFDKAAKRAFRLAFFERFGEQKLDVLVDDGSFLEPFHKIAFERGMKL